MASTSLKAFVSDLDDLIDKYRGGRWRISISEVVGALMYAAYAVMRDADEEEDE